MSSCEGKKSWQELVGSDGDVATAIIMRQNPKVEAKTVPEGSLVTDDFRCDRVRVFVDNDNVVVKTPKIG